MDRPAGKSIYSGHRLSEQADASTAPPQRTDQRLFNPAPATRPDPPIPSPPADPVSAPEAPVAVLPPPPPVLPVRPPIRRLSAPSERPTDPPIPTVPSFDLADLPYRKDTFLFTAEEFEALDDLKLSLRRTLDVKVTKNDLVRCAVQYLVEDFRSRGEASPVIAPLKKRSGR
jgi:hypothetical protein